MPIKALRRIQYTAEAAKGTALAATAIWRGLGTIEDTQETVFVEEDVGYMSGLDRTYIPKTGAAITFEPVPATFEQFPVLMDAGVQTVVGVADGVGSGFIYSYVFPTTTANTTVSYTIEGGDDQAVEEMEYSFVQSFNLTGAGGEAVMMSADWVGRQVLVSAFTGALTAQAVSEVLFSKSILSIDTVAAGIGTTPITNTFLAMSLDVTTGLQPVWSGDGQLYFTFDKCIGPEVVLNITFEHDAAPVAQKVLWRAGTARQIRVEFTGPALVTPAAESNKRLTIDMAGKWEKFDKIGEQNGNDIMQGTFRARYNATAALFVEVVVVNELAALP